MPSLPLARTNDAEESDLAMNLFAKTPRNDDDRTGTEETTDDKRSDSPQEDEEARRRREEEESLALARQLMAEEAMASYHQAFGLLSRDNLPAEDFEALQAALQEEEREEVAELEDDEGELSYDAMLQLGERIGDVKSERWALNARKEIEKLPTFQFQPSTGARAGDVDDSEVKCLVCQCEYEEGDKLLRLPCNHCFHAPCAEQWLMEKDICPYCRQCIVPE